MGWVIFVAGAVLSWGAYGALLHMGQTQLGNPLKALLCVGVAYFLIGVIIPVGALSAQGNLSGFNSTGLITATIAGALGAAGAACIIWAFKTGGLPVYVMPLVFGGAPLVNVLVTMVIHAVLGTSRQLSVSITTIAILTGTALDQIGSDPAALVGASVTLALLVGVILVLAGLLRLGFVHP